MFVQLLFDPILLAIVFATVLVWVIGPGSLHPVIIAVDLGLAVLLGRLVLRRARARHFETLASAPPEDGWRWPPGMTADLFLARCAAFLRLHGWRVVTSRVTETGDAEMLAQKDRARIIVHFLAPGSEPREAILETVEAARAHAMATRAALVCTMAPEEALIEAGSRRQVLVFRNAELEKYEPLLAER